MARKQVLVQLSEELIRQLDEVAERRGESRSAVVREAVTKYVVTETEAEKDRRLVEGYTKFPPDDEFDAWAEQSAREMFEEESW